MQRTLIQMPHLRLSRHRSGSDWPARTLKGSKNIQNWTCFVALLKVCTLYSIDTNCKYCRFKLFSPCTWLYKVQYYPKSQVHKRTDWFLLTNILGHNKWHSKIKKDLPIQIGKQQSCKSRTHFFKKLYALFSKEKNHNCNKMFKSMQFNSRSFFDSFI